MTWHLYHVGQLDTVLRRRYNAIVRSHAVCSQCIIETIKMSAVMLHLLNQQKQALDGWIEAIFFGEYCQANVTII